MASILAHSSRISLSTAGSGIAIGLSLLLSGMAVKNSLFSATENKITSDTTTDVYQCFSA
jgi:hypothetical protein